ncbi:hypothetical protein KDA00_01870 [Candidatus Saccharibacteria bacterium]|nr:hypothetical protein [Candidatus Saccharibacteria bacterium]
MHVLKKILIAFFAPLIAFTSIIGIITFSITRFATSPDSVKSTLDQSGIYDNLVDNLLLNVTKDGASEQGEKGNKGLPIDNPEVKTAIKNALPPEFWQNAAEEIIDGVYVWLNGDSKVIAFNVDLREPKQNLINNLGDYVVQRTEALPVCTSPEQIGDPDDIFNLACKPPDFNAEETKQKLIDEANKSEIFGEDEVFTATNFQSENNETIEEKFAPVQQGYTLGKRLPLLLFLTAVLLSIAVFFLHDTRLKGLRRLRSIYISIGASILVFYIIAWLVFKKISGPNLKIGDSTSPELQKGVLQAANNVFDTVFRNIFIGGVLFITLGIIFWVIAKRLSPSVPKDQKRNNDNNLTNAPEVSDMDKVSPENREIEKPDTKENSTEPDKTKNDN